MKIKKTIILSLFCAVSIVLNIIEGFIPAFFIPGVKLGLANIITLLLLYIFGFKEAVIVLLMRILLTSLLRGNFLDVTFFMSLSGGVLAFLSMYLFKKVKVLSIFTISVLGALFHSLGQIIIAAIFLSSLTSLYYLPIIMILSIPTGLFTGLIARTLLKKEEFKKMILS